MESLFGSPSNSGSEETSDIEDSTDSTSDISDSCKMTNNIQDSSETNKDSDKSNETDSDDDDSDSNNDDSSETDGEGDASDSNNDDSSETDSDGDDSDSNKDDSSETDSDGDDSDSNNDDSSETESDGDDSDSNNNDSSETDSDDADSDCEDSSTDSGKTPVEEPYRCRDCAYTCKNINDLQHHMMGSHIRTTEPHCRISIQQYRSGQCPFATCLFLSNSPAALDMHMQTVHLQQGQIGGNISQQRLINCNSPSITNRVSFTSSTSLENAITTFSLSMSRFTNAELKMNPRTFLLQLYSQFLELIQSELSRKKCIKLEFVVQTRFLKEEVLENETITKEAKPFFRSFKHMITQCDYISHIFATIVEKIIQQIQEYEMMGSGWVYDSICSIEIHTFQYQPFSGGCYTKKPVTLEIKTHSIFNIDNRINNVSDGKCFQYAVMSKFLKGSRRKRDMEKLKTYQGLDPGRFNLNFKDIKFPVNLEDISKFEKQNKDIIITVIGYEEPPHIKRLAKKLQSSNHPSAKTKLQDLVRQCSFPLYVSSKKFDPNCKSQMHVDLLLIINSGKSEKKNEHVGHFCLIKNLNTFLNRRNKSMHVCRRCLNSFRSAVLLEEHVKLCSTFQFQKTNFPHEDTLKFNSYNRMIKTPFTYFADFESFLVPQNNDTIISAKHVVAAYCWICINWKGKVVKKKVYHAQSADENVVHHFLKGILKHARKCELYIKDKNDNPKPINLDQDQLNHLLVL